MIHFTYKKEVPSFVIDRWRVLNPNYKTTFSLDEDCIYFLKYHFPPMVCELFQSIEKGMYKADLWRLCKLYIEGGVYADIDLLPNSSIEDLDPDTFYSCVAMDNNSIFQAFLKVSPKNPLILHFIYSFLKNKPIDRENGPTYDMYDCLKLYNATNPDREYVISEVKIPIWIGPSDTRTKIIPLHYFPVECSFALSQHCYTDIFDFSIKDHNLIVTRTDQNCGWQHYHSVELIIPFTENKTFFIGTSDTSNKVIPLNIELIQNPFPDTFHFSMENNNLIIKRTDLEDGWKFCHSIKFGSITLSIGDSETNTKIIPFLFELNPHKYSDRFDFSLENNNLIVKRTDQDNRWQHPHSVKITIPSKQKIYLLKEEVQAKISVTFKGKNLFDSHDSIYSRYDGFISR